MEIGKLIGRDGEKMVYDKVDEIKASELSLGEKMRLFAIRDLANPELVQHLKKNVAFRGEYFKQRKISDQAEERQVFIFQRELARKQNREMVKKQKAAKTVWKAYKPAPSVKTLASNGLPIVKGIPSAWKSENPIA